MAAPDGDTAVVNWYWVLKSAVKVVGEDGAVIVRGSVVGPSAHALKTYCVPVAPACVAAKVTMQLLFGVQASVCGVVTLETGEQPVPLTLKVRLDGDEAMVTCGIKLAVTDSGAFMVMVVDALEGLATLSGLLVQLEKT